MKYIYGEWVELDFFDLPYDYNDYLLNIHIWPNNMDSTYEKDTAKLLVIFDEMV